MSIIDFITKYWQEGLLYAVLGGGLIQISPLKWNPLSWLAKKLGKALNSEVLEKVAEVEKKVEEVDKRLGTHEERDAVRAAEAQRRHILKFADEIKSGKNKHSQESYRQILKDIKDYNLYCADNPDFENKMAVHATSYIEESYDRCLRENDFL